MKLNQKFKDGVRVAPELPKGLKNFIIDIDGVICEDVPNEEPERMKNAKEIPGTKDQMNKWYEEGHIITLFTARTEDLRQVTEKWLRDRGFRIHKIIFGKPRGGNYHYIDDKEIEARRFFGRL